MTGIPCSWDIKPISLAFSFPWFFWGAYVLSLLISLLISTSFASLLCWGYRHSEVFWSPRAWTPASICAQWTYPWHQATLLQCHALGCGLAFPSDVTTWSGSQGHREEKPWNILPLNGFGFPLQTFFEGMTGQILFRSENSISCIFSKHN